MREYRTDLEYLEDCFKHLIATLKWVSNNYTENFWRMQCCRRTRIGSTTWGLGCVTYFEAAWWPETP